ncbi:MAG: hypothetical protein ABIR15_14735 [Chitinophagaceae bacterium]
MIYVGAFVPANGQSLADLAFSDAQSLLGPSLILSKHQLTLDVVRSNVINIFCQDVPLDIQKIVLDKFRVEPAIPFTNKITLTSNYASVDKYYIHTAQDHAIGANLQNQMVAGAHITKVFSINTGHSPFLSKPGELTDIFLSIIKYDKLVFAAGAVVNYYMRNVLLKNFINAIVIISILSDQRNYRVFYKGPDIFNKFMQRCKM